MKHNQRADTLRQVREILTEHGNLSGPAIQKKLNRFCSLTTIYEMKKEVGYGFLYFDKPSEVIGPLDV